MTAGEMVRAVISALESNNIAYMVVGSFSSNFHGISRSTQDLDLIVELEPESIQVLARHLGPAFFIDPQTTFETVTFSIRNVVTADDCPFKVELFHLKDDDHDRERFRRRKRETLPDCVAFVATAEDVIITKLRWIARVDREKDRNDVKGVIGMLKSTLDWPYIESWCDKHGTRELLEVIRKSVPDV